MLTFDCARAVGLLFDRHWMIVAEKRGTFITQRSHPNMSQIGTALPSNALALRTMQEVQALDTDNKPCLALTFADMPDLEVPLHVDPAALRREGSESAGHGDGAQRQQTQARVWEWTGSVLDEGADAAEWLSEALKEHVRCGVSMLCLIQDTGSRPCNLGVHTEGQHTLGDGSAAWLQASPAHR